jgi:hypothetical protein
VPRPILRGGRRHRGGRRPACAPRLHPLSRWPRRLNLAVASLYLLAAFVHFSEGAILHGGVYLALGGCHALAWWYERAHGL